MLTPFFLSEIVFFNDPDGYEIELYQAPSQ